MKKEKQKKLEAAGWRVGDANEFLGLTPEEQEFIEMKYLLAQSLKKIRARKNMTQAELAKMLRSSQSRVAKMEAADPTVSLDLLIQSLLAIGTTRKELAKIIGHSYHNAA